MKEFKIKGLLAGKKALVTGGSRGLGRFFCTVFASHGADVAFSYRQDEQSAGETLKLIEAQNRCTKSFKACVTHLTDMEAMARSIEQLWGGIDILVNNAGISKQLPLGLMEEGDWVEMLDVNAKGTFFAAYAVLRGMIRRKKGTILNIGSIAGERITEAPVHYAASKAAVRGFTQALAKELTRYKIRVNCLSPGLLEGGMAGNLPDYKLGEYLKHVPLGRLGSFEEIAELAAFLVSDRNSYMNGAVVVADGGF